MSIAILTSNESGANSLIDINANFADLDTTKADLASPTFTGTVTLPTGLTGTLRADSGVVSVQTGLSPITIESTTGETHSLTTTAGQIVVVWAKGTSEDSSSDTVVLLNYDGTEKDRVKIGPTATTSNEAYPFSLMYTETPGAGTKNITVTGGTKSNVKIIVMKIG